MRFVRVRVATRTPVVLLVVLILLGLALRLVPLVGNPLHQDEALYGFWGRLVSTGQDPWLATVPVDKPPLVLYLIAGSQTAFGVSVFAVRLPGLAVSLLSIPLIYALARRLYGGYVTGLVAAAVMALTPYPVLFGAVAFTDQILIGWWLAACYAAVRGRWGWAGLMLGLAFATKQQAVVLAPLVVGVASDKWQLARDKWQVQATRFVLGVGSVVASVFAWDAFRVASGAAMGFWEQGVESYGGLRLIWPAELGVRLSGWARLAGYLLSYPWLGLFLGVGIGVLLWRDLTYQRQTRIALVDLTLVAFALFYLFIHLLVAFPVWDRYLLPMVPVTALLLGRVLSPESRVTDYRSQAAFHALLSVLLASGGLLAAGGRIPVGGDHGAYDGMDQVAGYLRDLPIGTVLYDRWLSWHYDFYLHDAYLYRAGFPSPGWLATDAAALYDGRPRYLTVPDWESSARLERMLKDVGFGMTPVLTTCRRNGTTSFVVYEIGPGR